MKTEKRIFTLCHRCEWRAQFMEGGTRPRYECGEVGEARFSCYMYQPVIPLVVQRDAGDGRPLMPGLFSARFHAIGMGDVELVMHSPNKKRLGDALLYWKPTDLLSRNKESGTKINRKQK